MNSDSNGHPSDIVADSANNIPRLPTGIPGVDALTFGGVPRSRPTLVCGTSASGKTVFSVQFLACGIQHYDEPGVFVAFEETPQDIRENMAGFGWKIPQWEQDGTWKFVDAGLLPDEEEHLVNGDFNLEGLRTRIRHAVESSGAKRVALDSLAAIFTRFPNPGVVRRELFRMTSVLKELGVTSLLTTELLQGDETTTRFEVEEYVADAVIVLRNRPSVARRRRTIEVLKLRGGQHKTGEHAFSITANGVHAIPVGSMALTQPSTDRRITSGSAELDKMCSGGFFQDSVSIVSGATGTGKTLTAMQFLKGAADSGERALFLGFEESRPQLIRNAKSWGIDLERMEDDGQLQIHCKLPESVSLEHHHVEIRQLLDEFEPHRLVVDSITAMKRVSDEEYYRDFVLGLTSLIKQRQVAGLYTSTTDELYGVATVTEQNISTLTDAIILLRYVEEPAGVARGITVLKMRGSGHDKSVRRFEITSEGMHIQEPFNHMSGILGGRDADA
ncbi:Circadian clock protein kinase KaiC [Posidoniimonas polymericola]|uniref:non-specific serine/threonine protein kinase n=1 Tax=Posidoniimonas polymericola TaxID=2528002 RepID=A0A5C5YRH0_9BACT|nr:circadian clock protein KaiC [Posidoniimonas polymericola]TWT77423.1 Circadian clock protein kinase KaiC [Posidoniimonas polymericola]